MRDYPTKKELKKIRKWDFLGLYDKKTENFHCFMEYIRGVWHWGDVWMCFHRDGDRYYLHTGGWSGNEDIICAMKKNTMFWVLYWEESRRGGHYKFSPIGYEK